jgi:pSer/pThr/pTyr-binding forkhead associated (FHA) protein
MSSNGSIATFLSACGAVGPVEVDVEDTRTHTVIRRVFEKPFLVVGRDPQSDLHLDDPDVSKRHAYLQVIGGKIYCIDLLSRTTLHWEHGPARFGWLNQAEAVRIGAFAIRLVSGVPPVQSDEVLDWDPLAAFPPGQGSLPVVALEGMDSSSRPVSWRMNRGLALVGQADECKLRIREPAFSRHCCGLVNTLAGLWVVDLLGRPGTIVNEIPVRWSHLSDGDSLCLDRVVLRVKYEATSAVVPFSASPGPRVRGAKSRSLVKKANQTVGPASALPPIQASILPATSSSEVDSQPLAVGMPLQLDGLACLLGPLAGQFAQLQQQMFDQFMQALMGMGQMFGQMQRDQLSWIREELVKVQQVNQDLQVFRAELARREPPGNQAGALRPTETNVETPVPLGEQKAKRENHSHREVNGPPGSTAPAATGEGGTRSPSSGAIPDQVEKTHSRSGQTDQEVHAQLSQRILALQQQRESLWHQLLKRLTGKRTGEKS